MAQASPHPMFPGHSVNAPGETPTLSSLTADAIRAFGKRHRPRYRQRRAEEAAALDRAVRERQHEIDSVLSSYLADPAIGIDMESLKKPLPQAPEIDPADAKARIAPTWDHYAPEAPKGLGKLTGAGAYSKQRAQAARIFSMAVENYEAAEAARKKRVGQVRQAQADLVAKTREQHLNIDRFVSAVRNRERKAVSRYFQQVLDRLPDPEGLPEHRRTGYVPETGLLAVEWELPTIDVMPAEESFSYDSARDFIESTPKPEADRQRGYQRLIAQLALRAVHAVVGSDRYGVVDGIVFNGVVESTDPVSHRPIRPCLISLRTTPLRFTALEIGRLDPTDVAREQLGAKVSSRPDRLYPVDPLLDFTDADPRKIHRPNRAAPRSA